VSARSAAKRSPSGEREERAQRAPQSRAKTGSVANNDRQMSVVRRIGRPIIAALALPVALLAVWWVLSADSESYYMPPLSGILGSFGDTWLSSGRLTSDVLPSILRLLGGFFLALVLGVSLGVAIGSFRRVRAFCEPALEFLRCWCRC
jgi:ABC-type nitrate/sulfonate/bicarbonate transport system permease component